MENHAAAENTTPPAVPAPHIQPATPLARKFVRYLVGFGVGVGVGLAPYLGIVKVPLFRSLLSLIPDSIQDTVIPLSAALMGTLAVAIQWYAGESVTRQALRKMFTRTLIVGDHVCGPDDHSHAGRRYHTPNERRRAFSDRRFQQAAKRAMSTLSIRRGVCKTDYDRPGRD
jgi:hypothetical protein